MDWYVNNDRFNSYNSMPTNNFTSFDARHLNSQDERMWSPQFPHTHHADHYAMPPPYMDSRCMNLNSHQSWRDNLYSEYHCECQSQPYESHIELTTQPGAPRPDSPSSETSRLIQLLANKVDFLVDNMCNAASPLSSQIYPQMSQHASLCNKLEDMLSCITSEVEQLKRDNERLEKEAEHLTQVYLMTNASQELAFPIPTPNPSIGVQEVEKVQPRIEAKSSSIDSTLCKALPEVNEQYGELQFSEVAALLSIPNYDTRLLALKEALNCLKAQYGKLFADNTCTSEKGSRLISLIDKVRNHTEWEESGGEAGEPWILDPHGVQGIKESTVAEVESGNTATLVEDYSMQTERNNVGNQCESFDSSLLQSYNISEGVYESAHVEIASQAENDSISLLKVEDCSVKQGGTAESSSLPYFDDLKEGKLDTPPTVVHKQQKGIKLSKAKTWRKRQRGRRIKQKQLQILPTIQESEVEDHIQFVKIVKDASLCTRDVKQDDMRFHGSIDQHLFVSIEEPEIKSSQQQRVNPTHDKGKIYRQPTIHKYFKPNPIEHSLVVDVSGAALNSVSITEEHQSTQTMHMHLQQQEKDIWNQLLSPIQDSQAMEVTDISHKLNSYHTPFPTCSVLIDEIPLEYELSMEDNEKRAVVLANEFLPCDRNVDRNVVDYDVAETDSLEQDLLKADLIKSDPISFSSFTFPSCSYENDVCGINCLKTDNFLPNSHAFYFHFSSSCSDIISSFSSHDGIGKGMFDDFAGLYEINNVSENGLDAATKGNKLTHDDMNSISAGGVVLRKSPTVQFASSQDRTTTQEKNSRSAFNETKGHLLDSTNVKCSFSCQTNEECLQKSNVSFIDELFTENALKMERHMHKNDIEFLEHDTVSLENFIFLPHNITHIQRSFSQILSCDLPPDIEGFYGIEYDVFKFAYDFGAKNDL